MYLIKIADPDSVASAIVGKTELLQRCRKERERYMGGLAPAVKIIEVNVSVCVDNEERRRRFCGFQRR